MRILRHAAVYVLLLELAGCASPRTPVTNSVPFVERDCEWSLTHGNGSVAGDAILIGRGGSQRVGANIVVAAYPATDYTLEQLRIYQSHHRPEADDPRLRMYTRTVRTGMGGEFKFHNLPAGRYIVRCNLVWDADESPDRHPHRQTIYTVVYVGPDEAKRVTLYP